MDLGRREGPLKGHIGRFDEQGTVEALETSGAQEYQEREREERERRKDK